MQAKDPDPGEVTRLFRRLRAGDAPAGEELLAVLYHELHAIARRMMGAERADHTLQPTALVHEAWLRLAGGGADASEDRGHFLRLAGRAMRRVLVDHARARAAVKRGGGAEDVTGGTRLSFEGVAVEKVPFESEPTDVLALDEALGRLEARDAEAARIVELRFFSGLTSAEAAQVLGRSVREIEGGWVFARGWLRRELARGSEHG
jgi:RNA polymerase sigma factor (TIGR02999 family)